LGIQFEDEPFIVNNNYLSIAGASFHLSRFNVKLVAVLNQTIFTCGLLILVSYKLPMLSAGSSLSFFAKHWLRPTFEYIKISNLIVSHHVKYPLYQHPINYLIRYNFAGCLISRNLLFQSRQLSQDS